MKTKVAIAVATFKRPEGLQRLLISLSEAVAATPDCEVQVVIVDNDPAMSAHGVCDSAGLDTLIYRSQPVPGISATRNAAVEIASGCDFIVFVDDDEIVAQNWLAELLRVQRETDADLVAGPVTGILPPGTPEMLASSGIFERDSRPDRSEMSDAGSGNLLCRYDVFASRPKAEWFRDDFGLTGGGDAELTRRLHSQGSRIVWAANAVAWEYVGASRTNLRWLARRYRRLGAVDYRLAGVRRLKPLWGVSTGMVRIASGVLAVMIHWLRRRGLHAAGYKRLFRGVGFVEAATGSGVVEYRRPSSEKRGHRVDVG